MFFKRQSAPTKRARARVHFLGAARTVTGSMHLLEIHTGRETIWGAIDCGMFQEDESLNFQRRLPNGVKASQLKFVLFTHAHNDHIGYFPKLFNDGFRGAAYATRATVDLMQLALPDSGHIQEVRAREAHRHGKKHGLGALYSERDARKCLKLIRGMEFNQRFSPANNVTAEFLPASHLLGAALIALHVGQGPNKVKIVFSGDLGRPGLPLLKDVAPVAEADYIICESTYGNRLHPRRDRLTSLADSINRAYGRATVSHRVHGFGTIIIPSFAMGRTQTILYDLRTLMERGRIPATIPVYVDSPMAIKAGEIYRQHVKDYRKSDQRLARHTDPLSAPLYTECADREQSAALDKRPSEPIIIISSSGNAEGGRVLEHLKQRLSGSQNTVIFIGHQSEGSRGAQLTTGDADTILIDGEKVKVRAAVEYLEDYSGHRDWQEVMDWLNGFSRKPKKIFLVHGEEDSAEAFKSRVENKLGWSVAVPKLNSSFDLE
jgi:metallo-beta-lactamase family protein